MIIIMHTILSELFVSWTEEDVLRQPVRCRASRREVAGVGGGGLGKRDNDAEQW